MTTRGRGERKEGREGGRHGPGGCVRGTGTDPERCLLAYLWPAAVGLRQHVSWVESARRDGRGEREARGEGRRQEHEKGACARVRRSSLRSSICTEYLVDAVLTRRCPYGARIGGDVFRQHKAKKPHARARLCWRTLVAGWRMDGRGMDGWMGLKSLSPSPS